LQEKEIVMRKTLPLLMMLAVAVPMSFVACDRTVSETEKTHQDSNGNVTQETKKVTEDPAGNVTVTKEKTDKSVDTH
jgi:hypothetical protein